MFFEIGFYPQKQFAGAQPLPSSTADFLKRSRNVLVSKKKLNENKYVYYHAFCKPDIKVLFF